MRILSENRVLIHSDPLPSLSHLGFQFQCGLSRSILVTVGMSSQESSSVARDWRMGWISGFGVGWDHDECCSHCLHCSVCKVQLKHLFSESVEVNGQEMAVRSS